MPHTDAVTQNLFAQSRDRSVLFLDLDGVVQTPALEHWLDMEHCDGLRAVLRAQSDLVVVVTSTHREGRALDSVRSLFPPDIGARVVGVTDVTALGRAPGGRQREILSWLSVHPEMSTWVAVDDEAHLYCEVCPWLVLTNKWVG
jgi:hypothetical protein